MGTTSASLHVLVPANAQERALNADVRWAYGQLGYLDAGPGDAQAKRVFLRGGGSGSYVSVYDSENDRLDTGELKELAVLLSRQLGTVAIVTGLYDSDAYSFVLYDGGKQIDAAAGGEVFSTTGLATLKGTKRVERWQQLFGAQHPDWAPLPHWQRALKEAASGDDTFAETSLARWCSAAGLDAEAPSTITEDFGSEHVPALLLVRSGERGAPTERTPGTQTMAFNRSDDDMPQLRVYPAAWPVLPSKSAGLLWSAATSGPGFRGLRLRLHVLAAQAKLSTVTVVAYPFFNGQITSGTPVARHDWPAGGETLRGETALTFEAPEFEVPAVDPQSRKQFLLLPRVSFVLEDGSDVTATPVIEAMDGAFAPHTLPSGKRKAVEPIWVPINAVAVSDEVVELNEPAIATRFAVLPGALDAERNRACELFESWLRSLNLPNDAIARVHTEKQMSASFNISKNTWETAASGLSSDKRWKQLFQAKRDYQHVSVEVHIDGAGRYPATGAAMMATVRAPRDARDDDILNVSLWCINESNVYDRLGTTAADLDERFAAWLASGSAVQAWCADATWFPVTDADGSSSTLYEAALGKVFHAQYRNVQLSTLATKPSWSMSRLRFVGRRMWLGPELCSALGKERLGRLNATSCGDLAEVNLGDPSTFTDAERVLAPILPSFDDLVAELHRQSPERASPTELAALLSVIAEREPGTARFEEALKVIDEAIPLHSGDRYLQLWASLMRMRAETLAKIHERTSNVALLESALATAREGKARLDDLMLGEDARLYRELRIATAATLGALLRKLGERESGTARLEEAAAIFEALVDELPETPDSFSTADLARRTMVLQAALASLHIAARRGDAAMAGAEMQRVEQAMAYLRASPQWPLFTKWEALEQRAREIHAAVAERP